MPDLDALMCANDLIALGALDVLRARAGGCREDVAVVGMDDTDLAAASWPSLTSVSLGSAERGRAAAELLLDRLATATASPGWSRSSPGCVRASTAARRPRGPS